MSNIWTTIFQCGHTLISSYARKWKQYVIPSNVYCTVTVKGLIHSFPLVTIPTILQSDVVNHYILFWNMKTMTCCHFVLPDQLKIDLVLSTCLYSLWSQTESESWLFTARRGSHTHTHTHTHTCLVECVTCNHT